ncbi:hypothetical protein A9Q99_12730 [Gammaproteobacteria bacterium 45_16_T64]|nr:hypothetical protein A9Q99_12730 [Gammaproteobacteria bacterium 45_16_T64]
MSNKPFDDAHERVFIEKAKSALDESVNDIDADTLIRLNAIRQQAVYPAEESSRSWWQWSGAGSIVMALVVAMFWFANPVVEAPDHSEANLALLSDEAISDEDIELLEDIEFVAWLMEQDALNAG